MTLLYYGRTAAELHRNNESLPHRSQVLRLGPVLTGNTVPVQLCAPGGTRTHDRQLGRLLLYRLSYWGIRPGGVFAPPPGFPLTIIAPALYLSQWAKC